MSKPMLVTLPFVMLLLDIWPLERLVFFNSKVAGGWSLVREKGPFLVLSAFACVVTFLVQKKGGAMAPLVNAPVIGRIQNALVSYARYLGKTFWPSPLALPYPLPARWNTGLVICALVLLVGLSVGAMRLGRKHRYVLVGWFWFLGTLLPVIGLVQVGTQSLADRYTYLPLVGIFIVLVWGAGEILAKWPMPEAVAPILTCALLAALAAATRNQLGYWQDSESLFRHTLAVTEGNSVAQDNLGGAFSRKGRMKEAIDCFNEALRIQPEDGRVLCHLGTAYSKLGDSGRAAYFLDKSLRIRPEDPDALYNLGNIYAKAGDWDRAITNYRHALQLAPDQTDVLNNLGFALAARKQLSEAIATFERALKLDGDYADAHNNLATVLFMQERFDEAVHHYREAIRITPENPQIQANLGDAMVKEGRFVEAVQSYRAALQLSPDDARIQAKLQALNPQITN